LIEGRYKETQTEMGKGLRLESQRRSTNLPEGEAKWGKYAK
jgi:hypothetical protein